MKKQMKFLLFALLVVLMVATMVVVASAEETVKDAENAYYQVETDAGNKYYSTIAEAIADVKNGGTITILKDATEKGGITLTKSGVSYTITGGDSMKTLTMTGGSSDTNMITLSGSNGNATVTIDNVKFATSTSWKTFVYTTGAGSTPKCTFVLNNVVADFTSSYGIWCHQSIKITISGENTVIRNSASKNLFRTNSGAGNTVITITGGTLRGVVYLQTAETFNMSGGTLTGYIHTHLHEAIRYFNTSNKYVALSKSQNASSVTNFKSGGYINISGTAVINAGSNPVFDLTQPATITVSGDAQLNTSASVVNFGTNSKYTVDGKVVGWSDVTFTGGTVNVSGDSANFISDEANGIYVSVSELAMNLGGGATAPIAANYKAFSGVSATVTDTATFTISVAGNLSIGSKADLVSAITASYSYFISIPEAWHNVVMNNDDLKITLSGEALAQQSETPFVTGTAGTLIAIEKGVTTYTEGTHFFSTVIEGTTYFYATLDDVLSEVVNDGTITLLNDFAMETPSFGVEKTYTFDGNGFSLIVTPVIHEKVNATGTTSSVIHVWAGYVTVKNLTLTLAEGAEKPSALLYLQNPTNVVADVHLTLENFVAEMSTTYGLWLQTPSMLTVKGDKTSIQGGTSDTIRLQAGAGASIVTIEGGKFVSPNVFVRPLGNGAKVTINNGEFDITHYGLYLNATDTKNNTITINDGTFTIKNHTPASEDETPAQYFVYMNNANVTGNKIYFNGGEFTVTQTTSGCFVYIYNGTDNEFIFTGGTINCSASGDYNVFRNVQKNHFTFPVGGTFVVNADKANKIFMLNGGGSGSNAADSIIDIQSGTFDGGLNWFFSNKKVILKIGGTAHFKDTNKTLDNSKNNPTRYIGGINLTTGTVYVTGGVIETNSGNKLCCAIYLEGTGTIDVSGGVLKGTNNVIRVTDGATVNISGGSLTNIGAANQLIRVFQDKSNANPNTCTINIKEGANLVQNQNQYVIRVQNGSGIINMTGGTIVSNGTYAPIAVSTGADSEFKMSGGIIVAAQSNVVQMSYGKTLEITGGVIVMKNGAAEPKDKLFTTNATNFKGTPVVTDAVILFNATGSFGIGGVTVPAAEFAPSVKFGGESYSAYFSNAGSAINKAGAEIYMGLDEQGNLVDGIRFTSELSTDVIAAITEALAANKTVTYGTVIAPADYVVAAGKFTMAALDQKFGSVDGKLGNASVYVNVPAKNSLRDADKDGVFESFTAMLVNIKEANYGRAFAAVGYVVIDGEIIYSAFNTVDNARSAKYVATVLLESGYYEGETEMIAILNKYAGVAAE